MQKSKSNPCLPISTTPKRLLKSPANSTNAQGATLGKEEERPSTEGLQKPWERQLWVHLQGKCFSAKMQKNDAEDRRMGTLWEFRGKRGLFSIAELTPKVTQPQESAMDEGMHSGSITTQERQKYSAAGCA